eukprot:Ihof_evm11s81 gene=Ihof_evmTU11s81
MVGEKESMHNGASSEEEVCEDAGWQDWEDEEHEPEEASKCLMCPVILATSQLALAHTIEAHGFDFSAFVRTQNLDFYQTIKVINYIRKTVGQSTVSTLNLSNDLTEIFSDNTLLQSTLKNDGLLMHDFEEEEEEDDDMPPPLVSGEEKEKGSDGSHDNEEMRKAVENMKAAMQKLMVEGDSETGSSDDHKLREEAKQDDEYYVESYSNVAIHEEMLRDRVRTEAYRDFMYKNTELFKDKVVLDVGCGTGILSMFAARAGAKMVIGIDFSTVAEQAKLNVKENGLDNIVTIIRGKVEEVTLPVDKVDIIISEWMGYFLLFEAMFNTVLWARDRWLAPGGLVHPDLATMYIAGFEDCGRLSYWDDVYGFKMASMKNLFIKDSSVEIVPPEGVITTTAPIADFNMCTLKVGDTEFSKPFHLLVTRAGQVHALMSHFDCIFDGGCTTPIVLPTGPAHTPTHWKQTVFYFPQPLK